MDLVVTGLLLFLIAIKIDRFHSILHTFVDDNNVLWIDCWSVSRCRSTSLSSDSKHARFRKIKSVLMLVFVVFFNKKTFLALAPFRAQLAKLQVRVFLFEPNNNNNKGIIIII